MLIDRKQDKELDFKTEKKITQPHLKVAIGHT